MEMTPISRARPRSRRHFLKQAGLGAGLLAVGGSAVVGDLRAADRAKSYVKGRSQMKLGTVTYNLARDWDVATIIKNCSASGFEGVELRTTHAHKVEVNLTPKQRVEVKRRFQDSAVELTGLGSAFDYHTPDQAKLRRDIEATKEYIVLAHDVGAGGIKVRPNGLPKNVPEEKTLEQIGKSLRGLGQFAEGYGIELRVEVHGRGTSELPRIHRIMEVADHPLVGVCWNCNSTDLVGKGFDHNYELVKDKITVVHMRDLFLESYPFRSLFRKLKARPYHGYCLAEIPSSKDPVRVMKYYRALWLAYQDLL